MAAGEMPEAVRERLAKVEAIFAAAAEPGLRALDAPEAQPPEADGQGTVAKRRIRPAAKPG